MCRIVVLVLVLSIVMPVFAGIISSNRAYNYNSYYPHRNTINSLNNRRYRPINTRRYYHEPRVGNFDALEKYAFKKKYSREGNLSRLERLENLAFGAVQNGDYATRFKNVEAAILSRPQNSYKKSFLGNLANYFAGQTTGFTPSITDSMMNSVITPSYVTPGSVPYFSPTMNSMMPIGGNSFSTPGYTTQSFQQYSSPWGSGYRTFGHDYGTGSSIRILD